MFFQLLNFIYYHTPLYFLIQSIWRDEAFSYFMARPPIIEVIQNTAHDFNPPLYYLALHYWMKLSGHNDEMLRLLSFFTHIGTTYFAYRIGNKLTNKKFAVFIGIFTFLNPMLLYYAFEMRMYSFYAFFAICSLYFLISKKWKWYTITAVLGLYTHSFFLLLVGSYAISSCWMKQKTRTILLILKPVLFFIPWMPILLGQFFRSKESWLYPVDLQLVKSSLGNLFTNYEGTPGNVWGITFLLSCIILAFVILGRKRKDFLQWNIPLFLPLILILIYSILRRPLYVNRYLIFITVFEVISVSLGIWSIKNKSIRNITAMIWIVGILIFNIYIVPFKKKTDFKTTFAKINSVAKTEDFVYSNTPISFLESAYYYQNEHNVFVYNPYMITIPNYIGVNVVFPNISKKTFPPLPSRTFLIKDDASFEIRMEITR